MKITERELRRLFEQNGLKITKCKFGEGGYFDENGNKLDIHIETILEEFQNWEPWE